MHGGARRAAERYRPRRAFPFVARRVLKHLIAHCRAGFEPECRQDLERVARDLRAGIEFDSDTPSAIVAARVERIDAARSERAAAQHEPVFARSLLSGTGRIAFTTADRITPIIGTARELGRSFSRVWLETPDTNGGKTLSGLCRRLQPLLERAMRDEGLLDNSRDDAPRLHVVFVAREAAYIGSSERRTGSPWPMGIPRLRMPPGAPSRSTLKLAEAFLTFLGDDESDLVRAGMRAVDLGAAPGGWTWQLAYRGLRVIAVDNGALKGDVARDSLVTHVREDGYAYRPRRGVDWMVCDIVDKPSRIAALVARWIGEGDARRCVFNLKLPMKKRYDEVMRCAEAIEQTLSRSGVRHALRLKQLYHDREEVTGYLARAS